MVKLAADYKNTNVEIVGISVDYPDEIESKITPFLQSQKVNFKNFVLDPSHQDELINLLNKKWQGAIPATFLYNSQGIQKSFFVGKKDFEFFKKAIEKIRHSE